MGCKKIRLTENQYKRLTTESKGVSAKVNFQSVGKNAVNKEEDIDYVLNLFTCVGIPAYRLKAICTAKKMDFGDCAHFHDLISSYQEQFIGISDGRIDPNDLTINHLLKTCNKDVNREKLQPKVKPTQRNSASIVPANYESIVAMVIDKLEGGYYHPNMLKDGRVKDQRYAGSGETMMGIDRVAGGTINDSPAGKKFWNIIDRANAKSNWNWGYKGGKLEKPLRDLAGEIINPVYLGNAKRYLTPEAQKLVNSHSGLLFNFIYGTWNGAGWFQKFAKDINNAVSSGITDTNELFDIAMQTRANSGNSLIKQGGSKIEDIFG